MMAQTVLVTGCSGFLGSHVAEWVLSTGRQLIACVTKNEPNRWGLATKVVNLRLPDESLGDLLLATQPDCIVHCAGSSRVAESFRDPRSDYIANVDGTRCLFEAVAKYSPHSSVIFLSSAAVYGQPASLPINELTPTQPLSPYGEHKCDCERLANQYRELHDLRISSLRIFSAYGPGLQKQVLWDIYQKARAGNRILLQGDGTETRDFIYVDDVVNLLGKFVACPQLVRDFPIINIATGTSISIRDLAATFLKSLGIQRDVQFSGLSLVNTPQQWSVDVSLLRSLSAEMPRTFESGIEMYALWLNSLERDAYASRSLAAAG
jgi:UDP-glucose 4-epimerase